MYHTYINYNYWLNNYCSIDIINYHWLQGDFESYVCEIELIKAETEHAMRNLKTWMKPEKVNYIDGNVILSQFDCKRRIIRGFHKLLLEPIFFSQ